jgi:hypothetical protein
LRSVILVDASLLCECAGTILCDPGKHTVTHPEPFDVAANGNNFPRKFVAEHKRKLWAQDCAKLPLSEFEIYRVQTGRAHDNENIAWPRRRCRDIHQQGAFRATVMLENVCAHESPNPRRGIATSPTEGELKRNQVASAYGRFTLVTIWSFAGQKRKWSRLNGMSVLPPRADLVRPSRHVRFVPTGDIARREALLSHLEHVHRETIGVNLSIPVGPKAIHLIAFDTCNGHQWSS